MGFGKKNTRGKQSCVKDIKRTTQNVSTKMLLTGPIKNRVYVPHSDSSSSSSVQFRCGDDPVCLSDDMFKGESAAGGGSTCDKLTATSSDVPPLECFAVDGMIRCDDTVGGYSVSFEPAQGSSVK